MVQPQRPVDGSDWRRPVHFSAPAAAPRLKSNIFARTMRTSWRYAYAALGFWTVIAVTGGIAAILLYQRPSAAPLPFPAAPFAADANAESFNKLAKLQIITLSGAEPQDLSIARDSVMSVLNQRSDLFALVFAPGVGDFYDDYGLLYRPVAEVQARVAYALSLKPLFEAVKDAPETASMAALLDAMVAAVAQGHDPQGLDGMLSEAAIAVQSLNLGEDHALDWAKVADLQIESSAAQLAINILPNEGAEAEAGEVIAAAAKAAGVRATISGNPLANAPKPEAAKATPAFRLFSALLMGAVFASLLLAIVLGRVRLAIVIFSPAVVVAPISLALVFFVSGAAWVSLWPILIGAALLPTVVALGLMLTAAEHTQAHVNAETALMLAAQYNGRVLLLRAVLLAVPFLGLAFVALPFNPLMAVLFLGLLLTALAASFTLPAVLTRVFPQALDWRAQQWLGSAHRGLFETGQWQFLSHTLGVVLIAGCAAVLMTAPAKVDVGTNGEVRAVLVAADQTAAEQLIERLRLVPSAASVQWLGSFLPDHAPEKMEALNRLQNQFPRIEPVGLRNPADIRDVVNAMQESLRQISISTSADAALKQAAKGFRQSLAVLADTSEDAKLRKLDNRLFGGFNRTAEEADALAALIPPSLESLPQGLHVLFGNATGPFRLLVTPVEGVAPDQLAETLAQLGYPVMHPAVAALRMQNARLTALAQVFFTAVLVTTVLLGLSATSFGGFIASILVGLTTAVVVAAVETLWQEPWSLQWLLGLCVVFAWAGSCLVAAPPRERSTLVSAINVFIPPGVLLLLGVPLDLLGLDVAAQQFLPVAINLVVVSTVIGLFQRHGAETRAF